MSTLAVELERITAVQAIDRAAVAIIHDPFEHVDELTARVLKERVDLAGVVECDHQALQPLVLAAKCTE